MSLALLAVSGTPPAPVALLPEPRDATIASMRATTRKLALLRVGADREYATIAGAMLAARAIQNAKAVEEGRSILALTPDYWVDILIDPGTYPECVPFQQFTSTYSASGIWGDVVVTGVVGGDLGTLATGGTFYAEGLRVEMPPGVGTADPKYPVHHGSYGTSVFVGCSFYGDRFNGSGGGGIGADGGAGGFGVMYECLFDQSPSVGGALNLHGPAIDEPITWVFVNCTSDTLAGYNPYSTDFADEMWLVGGDWPGVIIAGTTTVLHVDPSGEYGNIDTAGPTDTDTDWPVPTGCLSDYWRNYYYPA